MLKEAQSYLTKLGLKDNEATIYLYCLKNPRGSLVHQITNETKIKRSTIDLTLLRLRERGLISRHKEGARWVYTAEPPEKFTYSLNNTLNDFESFIPKLLSNLQSETIPQMRFYEGVEGINNIFNDILLSAKTMHAQNQDLCIISSGKDLIKLLPNHYNEFIKKRIKKQINTKLLAPKHKISEKIYKSNPSVLRESRFFEEKTNPFKVEIDIYANKLAIINLNEANPVGIMIENDAIATSMRAIFEMLWVQAITD